MKYGIFAAILAIFSTLGCENKENPVVSSGDNSPPIIQAIIISPDTINDDETCMIQCIAVDPDGDELSYEWEAPGPLGGEGAKVFFSPAGCCGLPQLNLFVSDSHGEVTDTTFHVQVRL